MLKVLVCIVYKKKKMILFLNRLERDCGRKIVVEFSRWCQGVGALDVGIGCFCHSRKVRR